MYGGYVTNRCSHANRTESDPLECTAVPDRRNPRLGYLLAAGAATMWAVNGSLARFLLDDGVSAWHLSELRSALSFVLLAAYLAIARPQLLRVKRSEIPRLAWLG